MDKGLADLEKLSEYFCVSSNTFSCPFGLYLLCIYDSFLLHNTDAFFLFCAAHIDAEIAASRNGFAMKFKTLLWTMTTGLQFVVTWWYRKQPVFYLPEGWLGPLTWWLSLPFAPAGTRLCCSCVHRSFIHSSSGSVSVGVWQMACKRVIIVGERAARDFLGWFCFRVR